MTLSFQVATPSLRTNAPKRILWHLNKLKDDQLRSQYLEHFSHLTKDLIPTNIPSFDNRSSAATYIEQFSRALCQAIYLSPALVCKHHTRRPDIFQQQFWTRELQEIFDLKEYHYRKWRKAQGINCLKYWLLHQETKAKLRRMIQQRRRETWKDFCNKMEKGMALNSSRSNGFALANNLFRTTTPRYGRRSFVTVSLYSSFVRYLLNLTG
ncbi:hypothetical protein CU097_005770 [Rhizopus azygosporus]|uniref:Uncharacterized protein n=1 Tax=Rhizopus azygosporus TaxID=86630 RepID=A0A367JFH1_RHIAZ|nr:hypothetical protein CU097_005770 [Rhizopus azygosporus]